MNTIGTGLAVFWLVSFGGFLGARGLVVRERWFVANTASGFLFSCASGGPWWILLLMLSFVVISGLALRKAKVIEEASAKLYADYCDTVVTVMRTHGQREPDEIGRLLKKALVELRRRYGS